MAEFFNRPKPVLLMILDGVGVAPPGPGNAITLANTPNLDKFWPSYPHTYLKSSGLDVGLPNGVDGNSEVGHMNIGSGKVVYQNLPRIDLSIKNESFFSNNVLVKAIKNAKENNSNLHIMGLVGGGQVHSSINHLFSLIKLVEQNNLNPDKVFIHAFTDGRDSPPNSAVDYLNQVEMHLKNKNAGRIASLIGRYYAMDRDDRWDRVKEAYDLIVNQKGRTAKSFEEAVDISYKEGKTDQYMEPFVITQNGEPIGKFSPNDSIIFFNFRPDRAVELTKAFEEEKFGGFEREFQKDIYFCGFTDYESGFPRNIAFPPDNITNPLGKVLSDNGLRQLRIAESEKFPHVTYFLDGGNETLYPGEDTIEVPSPKDVATYDQKPEMSAPKVTDLIIQKIDEEIYDFIVVNIPNPDMVSHTGVLDKTVEAMEYTDKIVGRIVQKVLDKNGAVIITADHGNAEEMIDLQTGGIDTKHSTNPVPFILIKRDESPRELSVGILADISPTVLGVMGIPKPPEMIGRNLLI